MLCPPNGSLVLDSLVQYLELEQVAVVEGDFSGMVVPIWVFRNRSLASLS